MDSFYKDVMGELLRRGTLRADMRILVVCGGREDRDVLQAAGFRSVVISNLDTRVKGDEFAPFAWSFQNAEDLTFADGEFDFAVVHSGLHHCHSPHRALLQMYRVSRLGFLLFEPYDNFVTRVGVALGLGQEHELAAVHFNEGAFGGVANTPIPNYVYRWTRREVIKTIESQAPVGRHMYQFYHRLRIPWTALKGRRNKIPLLAVGLVWPLLKIFSCLFPRQSNNFAALVLKPSRPGDIYPWLVKDENGYHLNKTWLAQKYGRAR